LNALSFCRSRPVCDLWRCHVPSLRRRYLQSPGLGSSTANHSRAYADPCAFDSGRNWRLSAATATPAVSPRPPHRRPVPRARPVASQTTGVTSILSAFASILFRMPSLIDASLWCVLQCWSADDGLPAVPQGHVPEQAGPDGALSITALLVHVLLRVLRVWLSCAAAGVCAVRTRLQLRSRGRRGKQLTTIRWPALDVCFLRSCFASLQACVPCKAGRYAPFGSRDCRQCEGGKYQAVGSQLGSPSSSRLLNSAVSIRLLFLI
jgi:hypothetical protein